MIPFSEITDGSLIEWGFDYADEISRFPLVTPKTGAYVDENRKLEAIFSVTRFQEFVETNASAPAVQLQSIRAVLAVSAYRKWHLRAMGVSGSF